MRILGNRAEQPYLENFTGEVWRTDVASRKLALKPLSGYFKSPVASADAFGVLRAKLAFVAPSSV